MSERTANRVQIRLLGGFEVRRGKRRLRAEAWTRRKAAALLQRLALERRLVKEQAIDYLWPDADSASGQNNLYRTIHALRKTLKDGLGEEAAGSVFTFEDGVLVLEESVWVDAHQLPSLAGATDLLAQEQAHALYAGDLLPDDLYSDWTQAPREYLRGVYRSLCFTLASHRRSLGDYPHALSILAPLLQTDPADETLHRELMRTYAMAGRRHDALRQFQACQVALARELEVEPSTETVALYQAILSGEVGPAGTGSTMAEPGGSRATVATPASIESTMIGREAELNAILKQVESTRTGRGGPVLVAGESGVGKTRLALEALCAAAGRGAIALSGACYEDEGRLPYGPFVEILRRALAVSADAAPAQGPEPTPPDLARLLPELGPPPEAHGDPGEEKLRLFTAVQRFFTALSEAQGRPIVLLIDDLHAADEATLHLFHYLSRQAIHTRLMLMATFREEGAGVGTPLGRLLASLYRERLAMRLMIAPLGESETVALVGQELGGGQLSSDLRQTVIEASEGNPFYALEIARALAEGGRVERVGQKWHLSNNLDEPGQREPGRRGREIPTPEGVRGVVQERVARLGPAVHSLLSLAAAIGRDFRFDVLGRSVVGVDETTLLDALDLALRAKLIEEQPGGFRFRHSLTRQALYDGLSRLRRMRLHSVILDSIEALYLDQLDEWVEALAFHAARSERPVRAIPYLIAAGDRAAAVYAHDSAIAYYRQAIELKPPAESAFRLYEKIGNLYKIVAETDQCLANYDAALGLAPDAKSRARIRRKAAAAAITNGDLERARAYLATALTELEAEPESKEHARVFYHAAQLHWHENDFRAAYAAAERALRVAERLNSANEIAQAFEMLALACHSLGEWQQGFEYETRRRAIAGEATDVGDAFDVHL